MRHRKRSRGPATAAFLAAVLAAATGCREKAEPVGSLSVAPTDVQLPAGQATGWKLAWNPKTPLDDVQGKPHVFVHVLMGRNLLRTFDHPLAEDWTPSKEQSYEIDLYQSALAEPLPAGAYEVTAGLYDNVSGERWAIETTGNEVGKREYRVATLVVPAEKTGTPTYDFAGGWLAPEPGGSKQVITHRCASGEASIAVRGVAGPGTLLIGSSVPKLPSGAWGSAVALTTTCGADRQEINGPEVQWSRIPIAPSAADPACEIRLAPVPPAAAGSERTVCLEVLAWRDGAAR